MWWMGEEGFLAYLLPWQAAQQSCISLRNWRYRLILGNKNEGGSECFVWHEWTSELWWRNAAKSNCVSIAVVCYMHAVQWICLALSFFFFVPLCAFFSISQVSRCMSSILSCQNRNNNNKKLKAHHCQPAMPDKCAWRLQDQGRGPCGNRQKGRGARQR